MDITLYEVKGSRSGRVRWALDELGLPYETLGGEREFIHSEELKKVHPLGKVPAITVDGRAMFESAAICTWLADAAPERNLIAKPGTWERAMHEQWSYFALGELEALLWSMARNSFVYPEDKRIPGVKAQCAAEFARTVPPLDSALEGKNFLVGDTFSVTDIIVGFAANWARNIGLTESFPNIDRWLDGLYERHHCTLKRPQKAA